jgi:4-hydroxy-tetrahydrodipicolinate synthase
VRAILLSAPTTLFTADGEVDWKAARQLYAYLEPHVDGVFVTGTMGEFPALNEVERLSLFEIALEAFGAQRVIAHVGTASLRGTVRLAVRAAALGIERLAAITPFFMPTTPDEVKDYLRALTESVDGVWYGYFFTERTGVRLCPDDVAEVVAAAGLAGLKVSGAESTRVVDYVAACLPGTEVFSGNDAGIPDAVSAGGTGVISGFSSAFPRTFRRLIDAINDGDATAVDAAQEAVLHITEVMANSIGAAKVAQSLRGLGHAGARMTIQHPNETASQKIGSVVKLHS